MGGVHLGVSVSKCVCVSECVCVWVGHSLGVCRQRTRPATGLRGQDASLLASCSPRLVALCLAAFLDQGWWGGFRPEPDPGGQPGRSSTPVLLPAARAPNQSGLACRRSQTWGCRRVWDFLTLAALEATAALLSNSGPARYPTSFLLPFLSLSQCSNFSIEKEIVVFFFTFQSPVNSHPRSPINFIYIGEATCVSLWFYSNYHFAFGSFFEIWLKFLFSYININIHWFFRILTVEDLYFINLFWILLFVF